MNLLRLSLLGICLLAPACGGRLAEERVLPDQEADAEGADPSDVTSPDDGATDLPSTPEEGTDTTPPTPRPVPEPVEEPGEEPVEEPIEPPDCSHDETAEVHGSLEAGRTTVSGRLPPEVIRRLIRGSNPSFLSCYEAWLCQDPSLSGRVATRFVIGRDGAVSNVSNGGSTLPEAGVIACVQEVFSELAFPSPEGGIVTVVYVLDFEPL